MRVLPFLFPTRWQILRSLRLPPSLLQTIDEFAVTDAPLTHGRVNSHDPQTAKNHAYVRDGREMRTPRRE